MIKPRSIAFILIALVAVGAVIGGLHLRHLLYDPAPAGEGTVKFTIEKGEKLDSISARLFQEDLIVDVTAVKVAVFLRGGANQVKAGTHEVPRGLTAGEVLDILSQSPPKEHRVLTIPEGRDMFEIAREVEKVGLAGADEFLAAAGNAGLIREFAPDALSLEGYLFPDTYHVPVDAGPADIVAMMIERSSAELDAGLLAEFATVGLSPAEGVILASLIAKEAGNEEEMPLIASVFHNRLRIGMKLDCDPTFIYASKLAGEWDGRIDARDSGRDSLYNTYRYRGLPPGPIGNPGRNALLAAARPAESRYIYFVARSADRTEGHLFSETYSGHLQNIRAYRAARREARRAESAAEDSAAEGTQPPR